MFSRTVCVLQRVMQGNFPQFEGIRKDCCKMVTESNVATQVSPGPLYQDCCPRRTDEKIVTEVNNMFYSGDRCYLFRHVWNSSGFGCGRSAETAVSAGGRTSTRGLNSSEGGRVGMLRMSIPSAFRPPNLGSYECEPSRRARSKQILARRSKHTIGQLQYPYLIAPKNPGLTIEINVLALSCFLDFGTVLPGQCSKINCVLRSKPNHDSTDRFQCPGCCRFLLRLDDRSSPGIEQTRQTQHHRCGPRHSYAPAGDAAHQSEMRHSVARCGTLLVTGVGIETAFANCENGTVAEDITNGNQVGQRINSRYSPECGSGHMNKRRVNTGAEDKLGSEVQRIALGKTGGMDGREVVAIAIPRSFLRVPQSPAKSSEARMGVEMEVENGGVGGGVGSTDLACGDVIGMASQRRDALEEFAMKGRLGLALWFALTTRFPTRRIEGGGREREGSVRGDVQIQAANNSGCRVGSEVGACEENVANSGCVPVGGLAGVTTSDEIEPATRSRICEAGGRGLMRSGRVEGGKEGAGTRFQVDEGQSEMGEEKERGDVKKKRDQLDDLYSGPGRPSSKRLPTVNFKVPGGGKKSTFR
ncbi:hypothetical protein C8F04DRAFT_1192840 [Mycena alexandri]|uniref:Uncharacterized protein n=1 Tax=Mycena alexandri TaxID=1745969 RepID=A0AAD6SAH1_9AGAR|nr:hypothetical protein C8F04DRAFT_1192840 [Mycena alexandri]